MLRVMVRVAGLVLMGWMALAPPGAAAQDRAQQDGPSPEARQAYETGLQAMEDGRWADALRAFERSYREFPAAAAMFNQGIVLRSLGRLREARDAFARVMADHPEAPADVRADADEMGREVAARVAQLTVLDLPAPSDELRLRFDGSPLDDDG